MKRAVIFSGGAFEKPDWVTLPKDAMILCADSGLRQSVGHFAGLGAGRF